MIKHIPNKASHKVNQSKKYSFPKKFLIPISSILLILIALVIGLVIYKNKPISNSKINSQLNSFGQEILSTELGDLATVVSDKPRFEIIDYKVVMGDTLSLIANKFGVTTDTIKWANNLNSETLIPGQTMRIPPVSGIAHKVGPGDTIYSLSQKYKSDPQKIVNFPANDFSDLDTYSLNIGQVLFIPDGVMPGAVALSKLSPTHIINIGGNFIWPTQGKIIQYPNANHMAVDITNPSSPPVAAGDAGVVSYAGCTKKSYGCHVILNHSNGYQTVYGRLSEYNVEAGDKVGRGQVIGKMGNTGGIDNTTEATLHFEIRLNGVLLNPLSFLK